MRAVNSHLGTTLILYLWTATIAFPVVVSAFAPLWVAAIVAGVALFGTLSFSKSNKQRSATHRSHR